MAECREEEPPPPPEPEEKCFHEYVEHLKRLQGGDYKKPALGDCVSFQFFPLCINDKLANEPSI